MRHRLSICRWQISDYVNVRALVLVVDEISSEFHRIAFLTGKLVRREAWDIRFDTWKLRMEGRNSSLEIWDFESWRFRHKIFQFEIRDKKLWTLQVKTEFFRSRNSRQETWESELETWKFGTWEQKLESWDTDLWNLKSESWDMRLWNLKLETSNSGKDLETWACTFLQEKRLQSNWLWIHNWRTGVPWNKVVAFRGAIHVIDDCFVHLPIRLHGGINHRNVVRNPFGRIRDCWL